MNASLIEQRKKKLRELDIHEVSLVGSPANQHSLIALIKSKARQDRDRERELMEKSLATAVETAVALMESDAQPSADEAAAKVIEALPELAKSCGKSRQELAFAAQVAFVSRSKKR